MMLTKKQYETIEEIRRKYSTESDDDMSKILNIVGCLDWEADYLRRKYAETSFDCKQLQHKLDSFYVGMKAVNEEPPGTDWDKELFLHGFRSALLTDKLKEISQ